MNQRRSQRLTRRRAALLLGAAATAWSWNATARDRRPRIGILWHAGTEQQEAWVRNHLLEGFAALGYLPGRSMELDERYPNHDPALFERYANELVAGRPDVLMAPAIPSGMALQRATSTIPIVFVGNPDPVGMKLVASLARPGGNITGYSSQGYDMAAKRLQLLHEAIPNLTRVAILINPQNAYEAPRLLAEIQPAAERLNLSVKVFEARQANDLPPVISSVAQGRFQAIIIAQHPMYWAERATIAAAALEHGLPTLAPYDAFADAGILLTFGTVVAALLRSAPTMVDRILKGANPAETPVEQPTQFELAVNLNTAQRLGITLSPSIIARADRVVDATGGITGRR